ncbi:hypothetical protein Vretimale_8316 [Volvox reticuliferus]|uniref:FAD/NAD(P)-binding domain-containing protein n=1 Tax=Volvox reticuliferus TaxID=1737510 RepID=A0A8J4GAY3_9CHLO|nr:hypothetical protein Vretifemale_11691 [Volvox reticuliferus]GIM03576.1 hypothetical protein Vretimale_8316 [Volvox reticuliferus]
MLRSAVSSSPIRTPAVARSSEVMMYMNIECSKQMIRMHKLGLSRILGGWVNPGVSSAARSSGPAARAVTTLATGASTSTFAPGAPNTGTGPRVVVLGGGFGGLYAAIRLDQLMWPRGKKPQITLVDQSDRFVFKPLLYELVCGTATPEEVAPLLSQLLAPYPVRFVQAQVTGVRPASAAPDDDVGGAPRPPTSDAAGYVALSDGTSLPYDYLLVALGSQPDSRGVPGVREWAVPFNTFEDAMRVKGILDLLVDSGAGGSIVVAGGGYAGVELVAMLGERLRGRGEALTVRLLTPGSDILEGSPEGQRAAANKALADLGVAVMAGVRVEALGPPDATASLTALPTACTVSYSSVTAAAAGENTGAQGPQQLNADLVIWTAGSSPATRQAREGFPFPVNARGALETEPSLRVQGSDVVFALGDVAVAAPASSANVYDQYPGQTLPATAQVAFQQADYAAWNIWAAINGRPLLPFRYQHLGSMMSLGQINAAVALPVELPPPLTDAVRSSPLGPLLSAAGVRLDDSAGAGGGVGVTLEGPLAALLRRSAYLYRQPTNEQRISVATSWLRMGLEAAAALGGGRRTGR